MKHIDYQLRQFIEIARYKSLSDAAISIELTQSALSRQLRDLENTVGHPVFRRHGRGIELTEQGETLRRAAQTAYKLIDTTVERLRAERYKIMGGLRVATIRGLTEVVIKGYLAKLLGECTDIDIAMMETSPDEVLELVRAGSVDIGFVTNRTAINDSLQITDRIPLTRPVADKPFRGRGVCEPVDDGERSNELQAYLHARPKISTVFEHQSTDSEVDLVESREEDYMVGTVSISRYFPVQQDTAIVETPSNKIADSTDENWLIAVIKSDDTRITKFLRHHAKRKKNSKLG